MRLLEKQKIPFILVIGDKEVEGSRLSVRERRLEGSHGELRREQYLLDRQEFLEMVSKLNREVRF